MKLLHKIIWVALFASAAYSTASAQLSTSPMFSSDMVLQQGQSVPVWGTAAPGEQVTVLFGPQRVSAAADAEGNWMVRLEPMAADRAPRRMTVQGEADAITYENIVVGEVWLCSGQSNMEYRMKRIPSFVPPATGEDLATLELEAPANEMIRVFMSNRNGTQGPWRVADSESLENVSAVGYFFAKTIQGELDVPVGIITAALGGSRIELWTPEEAYRESPLFGPQLTAGDGKIDGIAPGELYRLFISPLVPFAVKGVLWYQGENNCGIGDRQYADKYRVLVDSWRTAFGIGQAPFYSVILAPHIYSDRLHRGGEPVTAEELPIFRQQQMEAAVSVANGDYVIVSDLIDDILDIHPPNKWDVGGRLAHLALTKTYGRQNVVWSGPRVGGTEIDGDSIRVTFDHSADGLATSDGKRVS
ncbi:MAG: sialate O-acetylesterase [Rikenellaceae bacterium]|nr:sialate O-acetylesterase [Rikenellaceae bacterium]